MVIYSISFILLFQMFMIIKKLISDNKLLFWLIFMFILNIVLIYFLNDVFWSTLVVYARYFVNIIVTWFLAWKYSNQIIHKNETWYPSWYLTMWILITWITVCYVVAELILIQTFYVKDTPTYEAWEIFTLFSVITSIPIVLVLRWLISKKLSGSPLLHLLVWPAIIINWLSVFSLLFSYKTALQTGPWVLLELLTLLPLVIAIISPNHRAVSVSYLLFLLTLIYYFCFNGANPTRAYQETWLLYFLYLPIALMQVYYLWPTSKTWSIYIRSFKWFVIALLSFGIGLVTFNLSREWYLNIILDNFYDLPGSVTREFVDFSTRRDFLDAVLYKCNLSSNMLYIVDDKPIFWWSNWVVWWVASIFNSSWEKLGSVRWLNYWYNQVDWFFPIGSEILDNVRKEQYEIENRGQKIWINTWNIYELLKSKDKYNCKIIREQWKGNSKSPF